VLGGGGASGGAHHGAASGVGGAQNRASAAWSEVLDLGVGYQGREARPPLAEANLTEQLEVGIRCDLRFWARACPFEIARGAARIVAEMPTSPLTLVGAVVGTKAAVPSAVPSATLRFLLNGLRSLALSTALNNTEAGSGSGSGGTGSGSGSGDGSGSGNGSACGGDGSGGVHAGAGLKNLFLAELAGALPLSDADVHLVLTWLTDI